MDFQKEYNDAKEWHRKVAVMNLFHSHMCMDRNIRWTLRDTAVFFGVSIGLVSENVRLAKVIDDNPQILKAENRQEALKIAERRKVSRYNPDEDCDV